MLIMNNISIKNLTKGVTGVTGVTQKIKFSQGPLLRKSLKKVSHPVTPCHTLSKNCSIEHPFGLHLLSIVKC